MLAHKVHLLIESLDACKIRLRVICKLHFLTTSYTFGLPVEVAHIHRTSHFACDCVETCFPALYWLTCSFRCKREVNDILRLHLSDDAEHHVASFLSVYRDATELAEKPSEWAPEQFSLNHAVRFSTY